MLMKMSLCFFHFILKQVKAVVVVIISTIRIQKFVSLTSLMSRTNETRHIEWHETCKCKYKFGANICNNKERWNKDKCRCECKELIDKGVFDKGYIWNPSNCECQCDKVCNIGEYSDYENYTKKLVDKLVDECAETVLILLIAIGLWLKMLCTLNLITVLKQQLLNL